MNLTSLSNTCFIVACDIKIKLKVKLKILDYN